MRFGPNPMEFEALDDFEELHKAEFQIQRNSLMMIEISPPSKKVKGLIRNKNQKNLVILGLLGI